MNFSFLLRIVCTVYNWFLVGKNKLIVRNLTFIICYVCLISISNQSVFDFAPFLASALGLGSFVFLAAAFTFCLATLGCFGFFTDPCGLPLPKIEFLYCWHYFYILLPFFSPFAWGFEGAIFWVDIYLLPVNIQTDFPFKSATFKY